jgi:hypothetical protein
MLMIARGYHLTPAPAVLAPRIPISAAQKRNGYVLTSMHELGGCTGSWRYSTDTHITRTKSNPES